MKSGLIGLLLLVAAGSGATAETVRLARDGRGQVVATNVPGGSYAPTKTPAAGSAERVRRDLAAPPADIDELIREASARHQLSPTLLRAVVKVESDFDPRAVSPKGARGLMQLMPGTARELNVSDVYDPGQNLDAGAQHLRRLLDRYEGDVRLALAAYNAGEEAVRRSGGVPPYNETRNYIRKILALVRAAGPEADSTQEVLQYRDRRGNLVFSNVPILQGTRQGTAVPKGARGSK